MFLNNLNQEEKRYFWRMINLVSECDNEVTSEEKVILNSYKKELDINTNDELNLDFEELLNMFEESSDLVKKAIFIEIIALVMSDSKYDSNEKAVVSRIRENFNIDQDTQNSMFEWVEKMQGLYSEANAILM